MLKVEAYAEYKMCFSLYVASNSNCWDEYSFSIIKIGLNYENPNCKMNCITPCLGKLVHVIPNSEQLRAKTVANPPCLGVPRCAPVSKPLIDRLPLLINKSGSIFWYERSREILFKIPDDVKVWVKYNVKNEYEQLVLLKKGVEPDGYSEDNDNIVCWSDCDFEPIDTELYDSIASYHYETRILTGDPLIDDDPNPSSSLAHRRLDPKTCPRVYRDEFDNDGYDWKKPYLFMR